MLHALRLLSFFFLAAAALALAPRPALGYGVITHAWLAEEEAYRLAAADPSLAFLATDADARACFMYGAFFPDMRSTARQAAGLEQLRTKILGTGFVASVEFSTDEVGTAFRYFKTHSSPFILSMIARARAGGDPYQIAFALGNIAHVMQDKYSQLIQIPAHTQTRDCGDIGVEPCHDPASTPGWFPGDENELLFDGFGDFARPQPVAAFVRDAPWRLHSNRTVSYNRALALRRFYWEAAVAHMAATGGPPPSENAIMNSAKVFEATLSFYAYFTANEPIADTMRTFSERYIRLEWWAQALSGVLQAISTNIFAGQDVFDVIGPFIVPLISDQVGGQSAIGEILFAHGHGGTALQKVNAKYATNPEYPRALASGLLDRATYAAMDYEPAHVVALDALMRGAASPWTDDDRWPTFRDEVMRSAGMRSLLRASGRANVAEAPAVLLWDIRYVDPTSGSDYREVRLPADAGRKLRIETEMLGTNSDAAKARIIGVRLRADTGPGAAHPVVASTSRIVPARALDLRSYAQDPRPVVALDWTIADVPGAVGFYVEVEERRLAAAPDDAAADLLLTTDLAPVATLMQGRPHYATYYATYGTDMTSIKVRR